jgi:hypothetical protein
MGSFERRPIRDGLHQKPYAYMASMNLDELRALLRQRCDEAGSVRAWALKHGVSPVYVGHVLAGKRGRARRCWMPSGWCGLSATLRRSDVGGVKHDPAQRVRRHAHNASYQLHQIGLTAAA